MEVGESGSEEDPIVLPAIEKEPMVGKAEERFMEGRKKTRLLEPHLPVALRSLLEVPAG